MDLILVLQDSFGILILYYGLACNMAGFSLFYPKVDSLRVLRSHLKKEISLLDQMHKIGVLINPNEKFTLLISRAKFL